MISLDQEGLFLRSSSEVRESYKQLDQIEGIFHGDIYSRNEKERMVGLESITKGLLVQIDDESPDIKQGLLKLIILYNECPFYEIHLRIDEFFKLITPVRRFLIIIISAL